MLTSYWCDLSFQTYATVNARSACTLLIFVAANGFIAVSKRQTKICKQVKQHDQTQTKGYVSNPACVTGL